MEIAPLPALDLVPRPRENDYRSRDGWRWGPDDEQFVWMRCGVTEKESMWRVGSERLDLCRGCGKQFHVCAELMCRLYCMVVIEAGPFG